MTSFVIEHQCPQCGAPADLQETDRLFKCDYCRVQSYLTAPGVFRYRLPHRAPAGKDLIYVPYWRFKGMWFWCTSEALQNRVVDISHRAVSAGCVPVSLGFRSQTQKLSYAHNDTKGAFIKPRTALTRLTQGLGKRFGLPQTDPIRFQTYIGETSSLIYAPFYAGKRLYDAILNRPTGSGSAEDLQPFVQTAETPRWPLTFLPAQCPQCGWDLAGERDSLTLNCTNCKTVWWAKNGNFESLNAAHVPVKEGDWIHMPFWCIRADVNHLRLENFSDLVKLANLPMVAPRDRAQEPFYFWCPAFKIRPRQFLTLAGAVTRHQPQKSLRPGQPPDRRIQAVNLPVQEAVESLALILSRLMRPRKKMLEILPSIHIRPRSVVLAYLAFRDSHHELIHPDIRLAINKNVLGHAKNL